ncbi:expressed unknown protein [Seminavis robusta]|uniref:Uncharacterized protein n=1 Tax=Seminavis robusta TaxID=568900 RepID=A0A9N8DLZ9_9STRA|nr:expressed unknown protein [Seminavis robusta]|eukprot:Sro199_g084460.1 n/a (171) ;mRNA; f:67654-68166
MFPLSLHRNQPLNDLDSCTTTSTADDHNIMLSPSSQQTPTSPRTGLAARMQRRLRRMSSKDKETNSNKNNKFDLLARQEQRQLGEEIKTSKHYVKNLQNSYKIRQHAKATSMMQVFAKMHASDLSEEIQLCEQELKYEESMHSIDHSTTRRRMRDGSLRSSARNAYSTAA